MGKWIALMVFAALAVCGVQAADFTFTPTIGTRGDFMTAANWTPNGIPGTADRAIIPNNRGVDLSVDATVGAVVVGPNANFGLLAAARLTCADVTITDSPTFGFMNTGTLVIPAGGNLVSSTAIGTEHTIQCFIENSGTITVASGNLLIARGTNTGTINASAANTLVRMPEAGTAFVVRNTGPLLGNFQFGGFGGVATLIQDAPLTLNGTILCRATIQGTGSITLAAGTTYNNRQAVGGESINLNVPVTIDAGATMNIVEANVNLRGPLVNNGTLNIGGMSTLVQDDNIVVTNNGVCELNPGNITAQAGAVFNNVGTLTSRSTPGGRNTIGGFFNNSGTLDNSADDLLFSQLGSVVNSGTLTGTGGMTFFVSNFTLNAPMTFSGSEIKFDRTSIEGSGSLTIASRMRLSFGPGITNRSIELRVPIEIAVGGETIFQGPDDDPNGQGGVPTAQMFAPITNNGTATFTYTTNPTLAANLEILPGQTFTNNGKIDLQTNMPKIAGFGTLLNSATGNIIGSGSLPNLLNNGVVSPGAPSEFFRIGTIAAANYTQGVSGILNIEVGGTANTSFDRLTVAGMASLNGSLAVSLANSFVPASTDTFVFMTHASRVATFANVSSGTSNLNPFYEATQTSLVVGAGGGGGTGGGGGGNQPPAFSSVPTATPNPALTGATITFTAIATDPDGGTVSFAWSFGDGGFSIGASVTHVYTVPGLYDAMVVASDGTSSTSRVITIAVNDPSGGGGGGGGGGLPEGEFTVEKAGVRFNFTAPLKDSLGFSGTIPIPAGFNPNGQTVIVDIGDISRTFTLDEKGRSTGDRSSTFRLAGKVSNGAFTTTPLKFQLKLSKQTLFPDLEDLGFFNDDSEGEAELVDVPLAIVVGGTNYLHTKTLSYTAKLDKGGKGVLARN